MIETMSSSQQKELLLTRYMSIAGFALETMGGLAKDYFATLDDRDEEAQDYELHAEIEYELHAEIEGLRAEVAARDTEIAALKAELAELRLSEEEREGQEE